MGMSYRPYRGARGNIGKMFFSLILVIFLIALLAFSVYKFFFFVPEQKPERQQNIFEENYSETETNGQEQTGDNSEISEWIYQSNKI